MNTRAACVYPAEAAPMRARRRVDAVSSATSMVLAAMLSSAHGVPLRGDDRSSTPFAGMMYPGGAEDSSLAQAADTRLAEGAQLYRIYTSALLPPAERQLAALAGHNSSMAEPLMLPSYTSLDQLAQDGDWVEVIRFAICPASDFAEGYYSRFRPDDFGPAYAKIEPRAVDAKQKFPLGCWFYLAPSASGIWVNVGKSLRVRTRKDAHEALGIPCHDQSVCNDRFAPAEKLYCTRAMAMGYDSIQIIEARNDGGISPPQPNLIMCSGACARDEVHGPCPSTLPLRAGNPKTNASAPQCKCENNMADSDTGPHLSGDSKLNVLNCAKGTGVVAASKAMARRTVPFCNLIGIDSMMAQVWHQGCLHGTHPCVPGKMPPVLTCKDPSAKGVCIDALVDKYGNATGVETHAALLVAIAKAAARRKSPSKAAPPPPPPPPPPLPPPSYTLKRVVAYTTYGTFLLLLFASVAVAVWLSLAQRPPLGKGGDAAGPAGADGIATKEGKPEPHASNQDTASPHTPRRPSGRLPMLDNAKLLAMYLVYVHHVLMGWPIGGSKASGALIAIFSETHSEIPRARSNCHPTPSHLRSSHAAGVGVL